MRWATPFAYHQESIRNYIGALGKSASRNQDYAQEAVDVTRRCEGPIEKLKGKHRDVDAMEKA